MQPESHQINPQEFPQMPRLSESQIGLCKKLDNLYEIYANNRKKPSLTLEKEAPPSLSFRGALFAIDGRCENNPDRIAQSAHSLREILYLFDPLNANFGRILENYGSTNADTESIRELYKELSDLAHHGREPRSSAVKKTGFANYSIERFRNLVNRFESAMSTLLTRYTDLLRDVDTMMTENPPEEETYNVATMAVTAHTKKKVNKDYIRELLDVSLNMRDYFYSKVDERWFDWLCKEGFFNVLKGAPKQEADWVGTPELNCLNRMAQKEEMTSKVVDVMLDIDISEGDDLNPNTLWVFLRICAKLPAKELARMVEKIRKEGWMRLSYRYLNFPIAQHSYNEMLIRLHNKRYSKSLLTLAEDILSVRDDIGARLPIVYEPNPFYFEETVKIFDALTKNADGFGNEHIENSLKLITDVTSKIFSLQTTVERDDNSLYDCLIYSLGEVDFFTLESTSSDTHKSSQEMDNVCALMAVLKNLTKKLISMSQGNPDETRRIYDCYIRPLPKILPIWRLRFYILSLNPDVFKDELKRMFYLLFERGIDSGITDGREYEKALQKCFYILNEETRRDYVSKVIDYCASQKDTQNIEIYTGVVSAILSVIQNHLTPDEENRATESGFKLDPHYQHQLYSAVPRTGRSETIRHHGPVSQEDLGRMPITEIASKLKSDWAPANLPPQESPDFLDIQDAVGAGRDLQWDISKRLQDYIKHASEFFDRESLDPHYTYSFLKGVREAISKLQDTSEGINCNNLIDLALQIMESGKATPFDKNTEWHTLGFVTSLAGWDAVHSSVANLCGVLLSKDGILSSIDFKERRADILSIVKDLFSYTYTPIDKVKNFRDINSVRRKTFEFMVQLANRDSKLFEEGEGVKIAEDVKELYEEILGKESSRPIMFMFGYYLPFFYFKDTDWMKGLLPRIFPETKDARLLYTAAWEGYLSTGSVYKALFADADFQKLYKRGFKLVDASSRQKQRHFRNPTIGIAEHLAIGFIHIDGFGFGHSLFDQFWGTRNDGQHAAFIYRLGVRFISNADTYADGIMRTAKVREKLMNFWDWVLGNSKISEKPGIMRKFGSWINLSNEVFEAVWLADRTLRTLKNVNGTLNWHGETKSDSRIWDQYLKDSIVDIAKKSPRDTLNILKLYFLDNFIPNMRQLGIFLVPDEFVEAAKILHDNAQTKEEVDSLVSLLLDAGGYKFWDFKKVVETED